MKFIVTRTSKKEINYPGLKFINSEFGCNRYEMEVNSLEDLKKFEEAMGDVLIISVRFGSIEVYDYYRE
jgi:hypothetical protein